jgi:hypothetical protein
MDFSSVFAQMVPSRSFEGKREAQMNEPRPAVARFMRGVLSAELALGAQDSDVAQRVMARLRSGLEKLMGPAAFDVLLARSLVLAKRTHTALADVTVGPDDRLVGLDGVARDGIGVDEGAMPVVAQFMELLANLLGEDLAMRLVRDLWPGDEKEAMK